MKNMKIDICCYSLFKTKTIPVILSDRSKSFKGIREKLTLCVEVCKNLSLFRSLLIFERLKRRTVSTVNV